MSKSQRAGFVSPGHELFTNEICRSEAISQSPEANAVKDAMATLNLGSSDATSRQLMHTVVLHAAMIDFQGIESDDKLFKRLVHLSEWLVVRKGGV